MVIYTVEQGNQKYHSRIEFSEIAREGDIVTYELKDTIKASGVFHYGFRIFPKNAALAHRQSFAYLKWF